MNNINTVKFIKKYLDNTNINYNVVNISQSTTITIKGSSISKIYICLEGKLQVKNEFENGFIYNFAEVQSTSYIGVMEIMSNMNIYTSTLYSLTECEMIEMSVENFEKLINKSHELTLEVLRFVSKSMYNQSVNNGEQLAYPAIYLVTNYIISKYESNNKDILLIKSTREEIATKLGFSIRTINRNLKILKDENLVTVSRNTISVDKNQFNKLCTKINNIK